MNQRIASLALLAGLVTLVSRADETAVVNEPTINVRGQASFLGEVITQLKQGEKVVILEEISIAHPKKEEPAQWVKIQMPANTPVWVHAMFIDPETKTVKPNRLNLRGGPGENYSVVGRLQHGDQVKEIRTVEDWMEIETPPGAYAFVAANLLTKQPSPPPSRSLAKTEQAQPAPGPDSEPPFGARPPLAGTERPQPTPVEPAPTAPLVPPPPPPVTERSVQPEVSPAAVADNAAAKAESLSQTPPPVVVPPVEASPATELVRPEIPASPEEPPKRIVRREGVVRGTVSIQAPTYYELVDSENKRLVNYLHLNQAILDKLEVSLKGFKDYVGRVIVVTGEESIDPRWPHTPVIEVETLKLAL